MKNAITVKTPTPEITDRGAVRIGGWAPSLTGPGLGVKIDAAAVERVTTAREALLG